MKDIVLIGMPACGKTMFGKMLANSLGRKFYDADLVLESREKRTIKSFFAESEAAFRAAETRTLKYLAEKDGAVIATGGGAILIEENMKILSENGYIIFIDRKPENLLKNIQGDDRPLLAENKQRIYDLYAQRIDLYRKYADVIIDNNGSMDETFDQLVRQWDLIRAD